MKGLETGTSFLTNENLCKLHKFTIINKIIQFAGYINTPLKTRCPRCHRD